MGYRDKSAYEIHNEKWKDIEKEITNLSRFVNGIYYDGYYSNSTRDAKQLATDLKYGVFFKASDETLSTKIFSLPTDYPLYKLENLPEIISPPKFPSLPNIPPLVLDNSKYPDWYQKHIDRDRNQRESILSSLRELTATYNEKQLEFNNLRDSLVQERSSRIRYPLSLNLDANGNEWLINQANLAHLLPPFLRRKWACKIDLQSRMAIVQFEFPDYARESLVVGHKKKKINYFSEWVPKYATDSAKTKFVKKCLYSLIIRAATITSRFNPINLFDSVVINVEQKWFDLATGQPKSGVIASLQAPNSYLENLDLSKLDPEICFKHLKGLITPNISNLSPIRPIIQFDQNDDRLISKKDVAANLDEEANLAAMEWEDFEHLVAQLFEWEFAKNGIEVKVTRASRDRGVDAILFDPDPLRGGKYVLQAKRYTRTVDVSAVRDLYGTVMNEGANRGILITTASYGPDAYEFVKDKPISLVDGQNLLVMLQKHGRKYRIDLEEARLLNVGVR